MELPEVTSRWWERHDNAYWWQATSDQRTEADASAAGSSQLRLISRQARQAPVTPSGVEFELEAAPGEPNVDLGSALESLLPSLVLFAVFAAVSGGGRLEATLVAMAVAAPVLVGLLVLLGLWKRSRQRRKDTLAFQDYLKRLKADADEHAACLRKALTSMHPTVQALADVATQHAPELWQRAPGDQDYLAVSLGTGPLRNSFRIHYLRQHSVGRRPRGDLEGEAKQLALSAQDAQDCEVEWRLMERPILAISGPHRDELARALLTELVVTHGHDHLGLAVAVLDDGLQDSWSWVNALPHVLGIGSAASSPSTLGWRRNLSRVLDERARSRAFHADQALQHPAQLHHLVVVIPDFDGATTEDFLLEAIGHPSEVGVSFLLTCSDPGKAPANTDLLVTDLGDKSVLRDLAPRGLQTPFRARGCASALVRSTTDALASTRLRDIGRSVEIADSPGLLQALGIQNLDELDLARERRPHRLAVPLGVTSHGDLIHLDIRERALGGNGPHGVLAGATGYGKSALLRSMLGALVATHNTDELALLLVDYKGGEAFDAFQETPHLAGLVTDIAGDVTLIERLGLAIDAELTRRKRTLAWIRETKPFELGDLGGSELIYAVQSWAASEGEPGMPSLVIAIDEFGELLANHPGLAHRFATVCRQGRSLGIHFLFATQRVEQRDVRPIDPHLSWRMCLHMNSMDDARDALGTPDILELPDVVGAAILRTGSEQVRFKAIHSDRTAEFAP